MPYFTNKQEISQRIITRAGFLLGNSEPIQVEPGTQDLRNIASILQEFYTTAVHLISLLPCFYTQLKRQELSKDNTVEENDPYKWIIPADFLVAISLNDNPYGFSLFGDRIAICTVENSDQYSNIPEVAVLKYVSSDTKTYSDLFMTMCAYKLAEFAAPALRGENTATWLSNVLTVMKNDISGWTAENFQVRQS